MSPIPLFKANHPAVQSNLENLIQRSRTNPHPHSDGRRPSIPESIQERQSRSRRPSEYAPAAFQPITEAESFGDNGAAILLPDDDDDDNVTHQASQDLAKIKTDERTGILQKNGNGMNKEKSYGTLSVNLPVASTSASASASGSGQTSRRQSENGRGSSGNSRSRSKARSPPRQASRRRPIDADDNYQSDDEIRPISATNTSFRGRRQDPRPLSPATATTPLLSGDTEDVSWVRKAAVGFIGESAGLNQVTMEVDPAKLLDAEDLELPVGDDGRESQDWRKALRVSP